MADVKIADLLSATTVNDNDLFIVEDNADTKKITKANLVETLGINSKADYGFRYGVSSFSEGVVTVETGIPVSHLFGKLYQITVSGNPNVQGFSNYRGITSGLLGITCTFSGNIRYNAVYTQQVGYTGGPDGVVFGITPTFSGNNPTTSLTDTLRITVSGFTFNPLASFSLTIREIA